VIAETPELSEGSIMSEVKHWLARAVALVQASGNFDEAIELMMALDNLDEGLRFDEYETIKAMGASSS
jgi:hypothetical protein